VLLVHIDGELEAYDLATGDRTLRTSTGWGLMGPNYLTAVPLVEDGIVYAARGRTNATGRPDVAVRAYDLASGDELWTSDPLERFDDLRDLVRVGDLMIGRATNSGGSDGVVRSSLWGPDAYHRVAAWHIRDGTLAWSQKLGGGQTSTAVVDRQFDSHQRPAQLALVPADDRLYTVSDTALVALARTDGARVDAAALPTETLKEPLLLLNRGARLGVLHDRGMSFYQASNLGAGPTSTVAFENGVVSYQQAGLYLFAATQTTLRESKKGIYVINTDAQRLVGSVNLESTTRRAGNLLNGYTVTEGGRSLYVIDESGTITEYRVD
jgi:outer membrane protein assembly factor BamB